MPDDHEPKRVPLGPSAYYTHEKLKIINDPRLVALKKERRDALIEQFYKHKLCPQAYSPEASGTIFDPAIQRYLSTTARMHEYHRHTPVTFSWYIGLTILPIVALYFFNKSCRDKTEFKLRTGQIAYADRDYKYF